MTESTLRDLIYGVKMKNLEHVEVAKRMLQVQETYNSGSPELNEPETTLADALANLRHFCFLNKIDFDNALEVSQSHFDAEKKDW